MFKEGDKNGDGVIDLTEFTKWHAIDVKEDVKYVSVKNMTNYIPP